MKLSMREQIMLVALLLLGLIGAAKYYLFQPMLDNLDLLQKHRSQLMIDYQTTAVDLKQVNSIYSEVRDLDVQIKSRTTRYFPSIIQEQIVLILNRLYSSSQVEVTDEIFSFNGQAELPTTYDTVGSQTNQAFDLKNIVGQLDSIHSGTEKTEQPASNEPAATTEDPTAYAASLNSIQSINATVSLIGSYPNLLKLISEIEAMNRTIQIRSLQITSIEPETQTTTDASGASVTIQKPSDQLKCNIELVFYAIPKLADQDSSYQNWTITGNYGKANPFSTTVN